MEDTQTNEAMYPLYFSSHFLPKRERCPLLHSCHLRLLLLPEDPDFQPPALPIREEPAGGSKKLLSLYLFVLFCFAFTLLFKS